MIEQIKKHELFETINNVKRILGKISEDLNNIMSEYKEKRILPFPDYLETAENLSYNMKYIEEFIAYFEIRIKYCNPFMTDRLLILDKLKTNCFDKLEKYFDEIKDNYKYNRYTNHTSYVLHVSEIVEKVKSCLIDNCIHLVEKIPLSEIKLAHRLHSYSLINKEIKDY